MYVGHASFASFARYACTARWDQDFGGLGVVAFAGEELRGGGMEGVGLGGVKRVGVNVYPIWSCGGIISLIEGCCVWGR